jgi:hypothetical protein
MEGTVPSRGVVPPVQAKHPITASNDVTAPVQLCVEPRLEAIYAQMKYKIHAELLKKYPLAHNAFLREAHEVLDSTSEKLLFLYAENLNVVEPIARIAKPKKRGAITSK